MLARISRSRVTCTTSRLLIAQRFQLPSITVNIDKYRRFNESSAQTCKMAANKEWHEAYPNPRNQSPDAITREDLLERLQKDQKPGVDFLLVDLRKVDYQGGTIKGSLNLPAQSLYYSLPTLLNICQHAGIKSVIFYCGSSQHRGSRAAGWFDDLIKDRQVVGVRSFILRDGVGGWARAGDEYTRMMDEYDAQTWASK
ncbi:hypothetical protein ABEF93_003340 [Exophiala dermatitidis]